MVGNILEHYDNALFGLLAPFIAPLFFDTSDPLTALIMTYSIMPLGIVTRPLGSLFFGWIGDTFGRRQALSLSLLGMALVTVAMGFLPVYSDVGALAPLCLALLRMLQSFFAAGESAGGAIYVLEHTESAKRTIISSIYDASSVGGVLFASALVTLLSAFGSMDYGWRYLFWGGSFTAICGYVLRHALRDEGEYLLPQREPIAQVLKENIRPLFCIACTAGFSYITYSLPLVLMNGYIPLVTNLSKTEVMKINNYLLVLDMLLLPAFGYLAFRIGKEKVMRSAALFSALIALPLFYVIESSSLVMVIGARTLLVVAGVAFAAPYHAWALEQVAVSKRYTILSLGYALGSQLIGMPAAAVSLWLYRVTGQAAAPGLYLLVFGLLAYFVVRRTVTQKGMSFYAPNLQSE